MIGARARSWCKNGMAQKCRKSNIFLERLFPTVFLYLSGPAGGRSLRARILVWQDVACGDDPVFAPRIVEAIFFVHRGVEGRFCVTRSNRVICFGSYVLFCPRGFAEVCHCMAKHVCVI